MKIGVFASILMVTAVSFYLWSPAKTTSAFDWTTVDGTSPYLASLSGSNEIRISATPTATQQIYSKDDTLELNTTCPYGVGVFLNMESSESNALSRAGEDDGIKTIQATTGTSLIDNSWGFSLDDGTTYLPVPLSGATPATIYTSEQIEDHTAIAVKYGIKIDSTIPSGLYSNKVVYSIVANESCARYTLHFDTDGGTEIEDVTLTYGQLIDLPDYVTTKEGFDFGGWELTGSVDTTYDGTETDVDVNPGNALSVELKAKWLAAQTDFFSLRDMQAMTPKICAEATIPSLNADRYDTDGSHIGDTSYIPQITIRDTRDGSEYIVRKLADGRCWMTENLRIGGDEPITLHPDDSDVASDFELPASGTNFTAYDTPAIKIDSENGGYYNWNAATAGEGINNMTSGDTTHSICPKGWRLPTGGANGEFQTLYGNYNSVSALMGTPGLTASGTADGSGLGSVGLYWSSTASSGSYAYSFRFQAPNTIEPANNSVKITGLSVRCVADVTMQTFTETMLSDGGEMRLVDERDGKYYNVKKLTDGNVWMTENLRIGGSEPMTLTPEKSNVTSDFILPASSMAGSDFSAFDTKNVYIDSTYGGFYNWYTATAGEGTQAMSSGVTEQSICPKNWRMPTAGPSSEFYTLYTKYNTSALLRGTPGLTLAGLAGDGRIINPGSMGDVWGSNASSSERAYNFGLAPSAVYPNDDSVKTMGAQVRCIADERYYITLNAGEGTVSETRIKVSRGKTVTLPTPTLNNHTFLGWYTEETDGEKIDPSKTEWTEDMTLYAHWQMNSMQNFTCSSLTSVGASKDLVDTRDGNMYTVKKLADGRCWMANSLKLGSNKWMTLTSADTDIEKASFSLRPSNGDYSSTYGLSLYVTSTYGGYYNWYTATAGDGSSSMTSGNASHSICPKGWKLPSSSEFSTLISNYNSASAIRGVPNFTLGGSTAFVSNTVNFQGSSGDYWSSTVVNADNAYFLYISSGVNVGNDYRYMGYQIRCVSRN